MDREVRAVNHVFGDLPVALKTARNIVVHNIADVGLVNAHSKRNRRNHNEIARRHELFLARSLLLGLHAGVERASFEALLPELVGQIFRVLLQRHIDYRGSRV